jgi:hypothetical protein
MTDADVRLFTLRLVMYELTYSQVSNQPDPRNAIATMFENISAELDALKAEDRPPHVQAFETDVRADLAQFFAAVQARLDRREKRAPRRRK